MKTRKTTFPVVPLSNITSLVALERSAAAMNARPPERILSVSYDHSLSRTREMLLAAAGYRVNSVLNCTAAIELCQHQAFDLIVIGHSIPFRERKALLQEIRVRCATPILALHRPGEVRLQEADHHFDSTEPPEQLLRAINRLLPRDKESGVDCVNRA